MLVYGDPGFSTQLQTMALQIDQRMRSLPRPLMTLNLEAARAWLIHCGQFEQAVTDLADTLDPCRSRRLAAQARALTDAAARMFTALLLPAARSNPHRDEADLQQLQRVIRAMLADQEIADASLQVTLPEGFAFYALYPEQYVHAALRWHALQPGQQNGQAVIVGIRSIGTTLSAVVAAALSRLGWQTTRTTVRPVGHPFARVLREGELDDVLSPQARYLVVDEGPGLSGSSMAAVHQQLHRHGIVRAAITFLPGHLHGPGRCASAEVRQCWQGTQQVCSSHDDPCWQGRTLKQWLLATQPGDPLADTPAPVDLSAGQWRRLIYGESDRVAWPPVCTPLEQMKFLTRTRHGAAMLWKFAGLAIDAAGQSQADHQFDLLRKRAADGWTFAPATLRAGFIALPWIEAARPAVDAVDPHAIADVVRYVRAVAGRTLAPTQQLDGLARLRSMLHCNAGELDPDLATACDAVADRALRHLPGIDMPAFGDGRMGLHEWARLPERWQKFDAAGHAADHTLVGEQIFAWDLAGVAVDWNLPAPQRDLLRQQAAFAGLPEIHPELFRFLQMSYAAFRAGQCVLCLQHDDDMHEKMRQRQAIARYRECLKSLARGPS